MERTRYITPADYSLYIGAELPFSWENLREMVRKRDCSKLRVGDYKMIRLSSQEEVCMEIAGIDTYLGYGDQMTGPHIDFISRDCLTKRHAYNLTATNAGGFLCSHLAMVLQTEIFPQLPEDLQGMIAEKRALVECKTGRYADTWSWQNIGKLWLPTEIEIWGHSTFCERPWGEGLPVQYPLFRDSTLHIVKRLGIGGDRYNWWAANTAGGDSTMFCHAGRFGLPNRNPATQRFGVPICFRIA